MSGDARAARRMVAFLRGINLGKRRLTMDRLADVVSAAGLANVATFMASGNVIFDDPGGDLDALAARFRSHLEDSLGYPVDTFLRRMPTLEAIAAFPDAEAAERDGYKVHVMFLHEPPPESVLRQLASLEAPDDRFRARDREIFWFRRGRLSDSAIPASDPGRLTGGASSTMRTLNTVRRTVRKFG